MPQLSKDRETLVSCLNNSIAMYTMDDDEDVDGLFFRSEQKLKEGTRGKRAMYNLTISSQHCPITFGTALIQWFGTNC